MLEILKGRLRSIKYDRGGEVYVLHYSAGGNVERAVRRVLVELHRFRKQFRENRNSARSKPHSHGATSARRRCRSASKPRRTDNVIERDNGKPSKIILTLGTALKGILWESTAIPEIRTQARDLRLRLLADIDRTI